MAYDLGRQIEQRHDLQRLGYAPAKYAADPTYSLMTSASIGGDLTRTRLATPPAQSPPMLKHQLPDFLKPLPSRMNLVDIEHLYAKGSLSVPATMVRNALLRAYCEWVHPYMPILELHHVLGVINDETGRSGQMSLLLFQAMLLYDLDYEVDRISLIQSLLLMTYWYESPDDPKDTWHWMGVAISLGHTIGLHRDPDGSSLQPAKQKLWKRIWFSCLMRDRLVALGMRRPTRIKETDYNVPMLEESDFETDALPAHITIIGPECTLLRDVEALRQLKRTRGKLERLDEVEACDVKLRRWFGDLDATSRYQGNAPRGSSEPSLFLHCSLLHMIYYTTIADVAVQFMEAAVRLARIGESVKVRGAADSLGGEEHVQKRPSKHHQSDGGKLDGLTARTPPESASPASLQALSPALPQGMGMHNGVHDSLDGVIDGGVDDGIKNGMNDNISHGMANGVANDTGNGMETLGRRR
ncbi:fungal specific transcription factor domain-containing protein [Diplocarpon rosae]|nr:fungal specific transcription factor domain-containing protein [Diplocarpon rosae]